MALFSLTAGPLANHLEGVATGNVTGSTEDSLYPWSNCERAKALDPFRPGRFTSTPAADEFVNIDKNRVQYSGAEGLPLGPLASDPNAWVVVLDDPGDPAGSITVVSTPVNSGAQAFQLSAATGEAGIEAALMYQDIQIRAGEVGTVQVYLRGDGTRVARARVLILETGQYVLANGSFTLTPTDFHSNATTSYVLETADFTAPAYTQQKPDGLWTLRLTAYITNAAVGDAFMDDFVYWPHTDTAAMIGHNIMPVISAYQLRRSTDNFVANDVLDTTLTVIQPNLYSLLGAMRSERYWRFRAVGTAPPAPVGRPDLGAIWNGQPWLLQRLEFDRSPNFGFREIRAREFTPQSTTAGAVRRYFKEDKRRVDLAFGWTHPDNTDFAEVLGKIFERAQYGSHPALVIRATDDVASAHMVWMPGEYITEYIESGVRHARDVPEMQFQGLAYPTFTG